MTQEEFERMVTAKLMRAFIQPICAVPALTPSERMILSRLELEWECEEIAAENEIEWSVSYEDPDD